MQCRIGYFTFDSVDNLNETIEEFKSEPLETITSSALVTADQFSQLQLELTTLKKQFNDAFSALAQLGTDSVIKKLKNYLPPRGFLEWSPSAEDRREGITRGDLIQKFGFSSTKDFEDAATFLELEPDEYLEELSGWQKRPVESGSSRMRFFAPK